MSEHWTWSQAALAFCLMWCFVFGMYGVGLVISFWPRKRGATLRAPCHTTKRNGTEAVP